MINISVVEDDSFWREGIIKALNNYANVNDIFFSIDQYCDGLKFVANYKPIYDIIFLDVKMPLLDGINTAKSIRKKDTKATIIFISSSKEYALDGYSVDALDYLLKPFNQANFNLKLDRAIKRLDNDYTSISLKLDREVKRINIKSIYYIEVNGHYVIYHTTNGIYYEYNTLKETENKLNSTCFVKCNRCYLVNMKYVDSVTKEYVNIKGDKLLISRNQKKLFFEKYESYLGA